MAGPKKTAKKTATVQLAPPSPKNGNQLPVGNHPGNTGGKPGRSGRPTNEFKVWCAEMLDDPETREQAAQILKNKDHRAFVSMFADLADRAHGKAPQKLDAKLSVTLEDILTRSRE